MIFFLEKQCGDGSEQIAVAEWQWLPGSVWYRWKEREKAVILVQKLSGSRQY
jgi:hypothetical protein